MSALLLIFYFLNQAIVSKRVYNTVTHVVGCPKAL